MRYHTTAPIADCITHSACCTCTLATGDLKRVTDGSLISPSVHYCL